MAQYKCQRGDAMVVAVVILAVALAGALGWIFWQNLSTRGDLDSQDRGSILETGPSSSAAEVADDVDTEKLAE